MGFFSDLGKGIGNIVKAPFEGVASVIKAPFEGIGAMIHGSGNRGQPPQNYLQGRCGEMNGMGGPQAMMMMQMQMLTMALQQNMMMNGGAFPRGCCC